MSRIHIVGVGGPGMSAIATVLAQMGNIVSGSDLRETEMTARLRGVGVRINIGHDATVVRGCDLVAASMFEQVTFAFHAGPELVATVRLVTRDFSPHFQLRISGMSSPNSRM